MRYKSLLAEKSSVVSVFTTVFAQLNGVDINFCLIASFIKDRIVFSPVLIEILKISRACRLTVEPLCEFLDIV